MPTMEESILLTFAIVLTGGGLIGSGVSALVIFGLLVNPFQLMRGTYVLPRDADVLRIGAVFAAFATAQELSTLINYSGPASLEPLLKYLPFFGFVLVFGVLGLTERFDLRRILALAILPASAGTFLFAAVQTISLGEARAEGLAGNPGPFAVCAAVLYGIGIVVAVDERGALRTGAIAAASCAAAALLLSGMRGVWPALALTPLATLIVYRVPLRRSLTPPRLLAALAVVLLVTTVTYGFVVERVEALASDYVRMTESGDYNTSLGHRLVVWEIGVDMAAERPVFGHGSYRMGETMVERARRYGNLFLPYTHFHNVFLDTMVRAGIVGVVALLAMLATPLWLAHRRRGRDREARFGYALMIATNIAYLTSGATGIMFGHDILVCLYLYAMAASCYLVFGRGPFERGFEAALAATPARMDRT